MVVQLVRKDFLYLFKSLGSTLCASIVFALCIPLINVGLGMVMPSLLCYIGFYSVLAYEERNKMNLLNVSLPVKRQEICLSKYIQVMIFITVGSVLSSVGLLLRSMLVTNEVLLQVSDLITLIPLMIAFAFVYSSIMLPCIFRFGTIKARYVLLAFYISIFIAANSVDSEIWMSLIEKVQSVGAGGLGIILLLAAMVIFVISYRVSLGIWRKKDF